MFSVDQLRPLLATACCMALVTGCATLPDTQFLTKRYTTQAARFENARGPLSEKRGAAIMAETARRYLKR